MKSIECANCTQSFEYQTESLGMNTDGSFYSVDYMPDGYFRGNKWFCDECASCPECGKSLEKERNKLESKCDECLEAVQG